MCLRREMRNILFSNSYISVKMRLVLVSACVLLLGSVSASGRVYLLKLPAVSLGSVYLC